MTLLTSVFAAVIATVVWYASAAARKRMVGALALMYWGASLMWFVDAIFEYAELRAEYFTPAAGDMLNDFFLGLSVVALGLIIWLIILLVRDPDGVVYRAMHKKQ
jgi:heme/copper-type cytochrome/quinol oxidase subunit 3